MTHKGNFTILPTQKRKFLSIVNAALQIADRAYVIETEKIVTKGKASDLLENDDTKQCYLGM